MKTDYNQISIAYQLSKLQPWRKHVEAYTFFSLLGDILNQSVLDLACGERAFIQDSSNCEEQAK